jgi:adenosylcobinamide-GDP ribazoletransferase
MTHFKLALSFLTTLPVRIRSELPPGALGRAAFWFPWVGLLLGFLLVGGKLLLGLFFPPLLSAALVVALWAALTGGLHLDGLADCCDGLLAAVPPNRRLEILRDPRLGTFGGVGLALHLLLKTLAIASLPSPSPVTQTSAGLPPFLAPLLLAPVLARWLILPAGRGRMARPGGLGAEFSLGLTWRSLALSALLPLALTALAGSRGLLAATVSLLATLGILRLAHQRLGGLTGDVLGLAVELTELSVLLTYTANLPI